MKKFSNIIEYRVHLNGPEVQNGGSSGYKEIELVLNEDLKRLPNNSDLERRLQLFISSNTGEIPERIWSIKIKKSNEVNNYTNESLTKLNTSSNPVKFKNTLIGGGLSSMGKRLSNEADKIRAEEEAKEAREKAIIKEKVEEITDIELSENIDELQNQLSELIVYGSTIASSQLPIRKAVYNKSLIAFNRLKQNDSDSITVFEEQLNQLKPKWYHSIVYYLNS